MNPLVVLGVLAMTVSSSALMISFSDDQVEYSGLVEETSNIQSQRVLERVSVSVQDGRLFLENTGSVPVQIKEIRILDDDGVVIGRQKADESVSAFQGMTLAVPDITTIPRM